ncbi:phospholipase A2 inhibitor and Ly6/PLAUR domain-containing protein isoform X1 [Coregonus clupeaformis]|uniref:phospholipase A2 inhibitor and Ly6/PLAUR domain-containing protein isoform X1 n=1 Tax=Coregonus clupeaformis TaxID=59861 RepID=UPI001E1C2688|nr:phospholipase A2 inhibitor and Ly6/PLAUR domain-containing protein isoform X1 [Coregonus clupeaformis]XP_041715319.2 phospholipase A2 inhibitor and Ly6/PLAUR domain-containing protein isoform X1 [Coregonus clupeaformis]XP_041715320.2 phospholipase A2 inhibitor and Ly6/PLAUR domain-containing protein isoform X1 [Coregonus clupeaformis]
MTLILKISFTFTLFYTADTLQCYTCESEECSETTLETCSGGEVCSTMTTVFGHLGTRVSKECITREETCVFMDATTKTSMSGGYSHTSNIAYCCSTDGCNRNTLPALNDKPNKLQCYSCKSEEDKVCNTTVQCVGVEDHCFKYTVPARDGSNDGRHLGCASANVCRRYETSPSTLNFNCCKGSLCNNAMDIGLSSLPLLLGLLIISLV